MNEVLFSSNTDDWATPQDLFDALDAEFHFTLDPCSSEQNHKCDRYFTKEEREQVECEAADKRAYDLIKVLKYIIKGAGFELTERVQVKDTKTGRVYR